MNLKLTLTLLLLTFQVSFSQCELYDGSGVLSSSPSYVSCFGGDYTLILQSNQSFGAYTIDWGDGSPIESGTDLIPPNFISHTYQSAIDNYNFIFNETSTSCQINGLVTLEEPTNASIQIPIGSSIGSCEEVPVTYSFINASTDNSPNTMYTWDFGDGTVLNFDSTNQGQTVQHTYTKGSASGYTVKLLAENKCNTANGGASEANFFPVLAIDNGISISNGIITANQAGVEYKWLDCDNSNTPIPGETNQTFTPTSTGNYAVELNYLNGVCIIVSDCLAVNSLSLNNENYNNNIRLYPNPFHDFLQIENPNKQLEKLIIYSIEGKEILNIIIDDTFENKIDTSILDKGLFFIEIHTNNKNIVKKFIKR